MGIETLSCPRCGAGVRMGLPREAEIRSIAADEPATPDDERAKVRENACPNDHRLFVMFTF